MRERERSKPILAMLCTGLISLISFVYAHDSEIIFHPGLNVFSTPAIIDEDHGLEFSNGGQGISFATLINGKRAPITPNNTNIKPLEGYLVRNDTENDVTLSIDYDRYLEETDNLLSRELTGGWNLVGVTSTSNPFQNIANAEITTIVDFTNSANSNIVETTKTYNNDETFRDNFVANLGKAYAVFVNKNGGIFGGVNNTTSLPDNNSSQSTYSEELVSAYNWAYENGITTASTLDNANMYNAITRAEMAKMLANYAKNIMGKEPNTSIPCAFNDTALVQGDLAPAIVEACQLGIMGQNSTEFRPYDLVKRSEFGTYLSRLLWGATYEGGEPYYAKHLNALKTAGIMTQITNAEEIVEIKGYVLIILQRVAQIYNEQNNLLNNNLTNPVTLSGGEISTRTVFDGTFSATNKDITLTGFYFDGATNLGNGIDATLHLQINGEEVGVVTLIGKSEQEKGSLNNILIEAGKSINIKISAKINASTIGDASTKINRIELHVIGKDTDNKHIDVSSDLIDINITRENKVHTSSTGSDTVLLRTGSQELAKFTVSKNNPIDNGVLDTFKLKIETLSGENIDYCDDVFIFVNNKLLEGRGCNYENNEFIGYSNFKMNGNDVEVEVYLKDKKFKGIIKTTLLDVNGFSVGGDEGIGFSKRFEDVIVYLGHQEEKEGSTTYTVRIDKNDDNIIVTNLKLYANGEELIVKSEGIKDNDTIEIVSKGSKKLIDKISYDYTLNGETKHIEILKSAFPDYFLIEGINWKLF